MSTFDKEQSLESQMQNTHTMPIQRRETHLRNTVVGPIEVDVNRFDGGRGRSRSDTGNY